MREFYGRVRGARASSCVGDRGQPRRAAGRARCGFRPRPHELPAAQLLPAVPDAGRGRRSRRGARRYLGVEPSHGRRRADAAAAGRAARPRGLPRGRWHLVEPRRDALVVNIGDIVQVWSNDRYRPRCTAVSSRPKRSASARRSSSTRPTARSTRRCRRRSTRGTRRATGRSTGASFARSVPPATTPTTANTTRSTHYRVD